MIKTISIPEWHQLADSEAAPPVRIQLNGESMFPLVRKNRDYITVIPLKERPTVGDIVLFYEPCTERYIVHRVWDVQDERVMTWGDNCPMPDGWQPREVVWGKIRQIERGKRIIHPDPGKGMKWARFWHKAGRSYRFVMGYVDAVKRRIKTLIS